MTAMKVKTDGLNLRRAPALGENIIAALPLAHEVAVVDGAAGDRWWKVRTSVGGNDTRGYVAARYLREPVTERRETLIANAVREWIRFNRGIGKESLDPYYKFVGEYWKALGSKLNGKNTDEPWSAAFISYVVRHAGYGKSFPYHEAHWKYINHAISRRQAGEEAGFGGFRLSEHRPQLGDLVAMWRVSKVTFDTRPQKYYASHCDVVVEVGPASVKTLGGNVMNSVSMKTFRTDGDGFLLPEKRLFAVLRNNL